MFPKAVIFDLDYTLWPCWCDTHIVMPVKASLDLSVVDSSGYQLLLYADVAKVLSTLKKNNVLIIAASRTARPDIALKLLSLYKIDGIKMVDFFSSLQWGQGSKKRHVRNAVRELNLESALDDGDIILFDDETRNRDVTSLNCRFCHVHDNRRGLTLSLFQDQMAAWKQEKDLD